MRDYFAEEILGERPDRDYYAEEIKAPIAVFSPSERFDPAMFIKAFSSGMAEVPGETVKGARAYTPDIFDPFLVNVGNAISSLSSEELDREIERASAGVMFPTSISKVGESLNTWQALVGRNMPIMMQSWLGRIVGAQVGGAIALGLGQAGPQAGTPEEVATIPAMAIWGAHLGGYIPMVGVETENFLKEAENIGLDYDIAQKWARPYGLTSGVIEYSQQLLMMKPFMKIGTSAMIKLNNVMRKQILRRFLGEAGAGLTEGAEELSQGALHTKLMKTAIQEMQDRSPGWLPNYEPDYRGLGREFAAGTGIAVFTRGFGGGIARITQRAPTEAKPGPAPVIEEISPPEAEVVHPPAKFDVNRVLRLTQGEVLDAIESDKIGAHLRNEVEQAVGAETNTLSDEQILGTVKDAVDNDLVDIYAPKKEVVPKEVIVAPEAKPEVEAAPVEEQVSPPVIEPGPEEVEKGKAKEPAVFDLVSGRSYLDVFAKEAHGKEFNSLTPKQRLSVLEKTGIPIVTTDEETFMKYLPAKDPISAEDFSRNNLVTAKSGKYLSDGRYMIMDKAIADEQRAKYWAKKAKKGVNVEAERREADETEPVNYEKVIPKEKGEKVSFQGIVGSNFIYTTGTKQVSLYGGYVKMLRKYFPNAEMTMIKPDVPVQFWIGGKLKALLMPVERDIPFGPTGETVVEEKEKGKPVKEVAGAPTEKAPTEGEVADKDLPVDMDKADWKRAYEEGLPHWAKSKEPSPLAKRLLAVLPAKTNNKILEIGVGNGRDSIFLAQKGNQVTGIDIAEGALKLAKENAQAKKARNVTFEVGNAEKLKYANEEFDAVYSISVLHSTILPDSLKEVSRVLKPDGKALIYLYEWTKQQGKTYKFYSDNQVREIAKANNLKVEFLNTKIEKAEKGIEHKILIYEMKKVATTPAKAVAKPVEVPPTVEDIRENLPVSLAEDTPLNKLTGNDIDYVAKRLGVDEGAIRDVLRRAEEVKEEKKTVTLEENRIQTYYNTFMEAIEADELPIDPKGLRSLITEKTGEDPREYIDEMYDALEGAINQKLMNLHSQFPNAGLERGIQFGANLEARFANRLRSLKIKKLQQFSTPLPLAEVMAHALDVQEGETILEPTAGTGNLVAPLAGKKATLKLIEIDPVRTEVLKQQGYKPLTQDFLKWEGEADAIIMNPPWGGLATHKYAAIPTPFKAGDISQRFVVRALEIVPEGGRVVVLMPINTIHTSGTSFRQWLDKNHTVRAIIKSPAKLYEKRGTGVESVILVVDRGKTDVPRVGITKADTLPELIQIAEKVPERVATLTKEEKPATVKKEAEREEVEPKPVSPEKPEVQVSPPIRGVGKPTREPGVASGEAERRAGEGLEPGRVERRPSEAGRETPVSGREVSSTVQPTHAERAPITGVEGVETRREAVVSGGSYVKYTKLHRDTSHPSPTDVVIASHQASVKSPDLTYQPKTHVDKAWKLKDSEGNWILTDAQRDNFLLMRQAHLNDHGILNADQVGMGKTRQAGAMIMDEIESGEVSRYLYVTPNQALAADVISELNITGGGTFPYRIINLAAVKNLPKQTIPAYEKAVYIITLPKARRSFELLRQIGFDGAVFDECHKFNTDEGKASKIAWDKMHEFIPHNHITYMSATPGKDLGELKYLYALGEWQKETFAGYIEQITGKGIIAKQGFVSRSFLSRTATLPLTEQVIRELKMKGKYVSRELSMENIPMEQVDASFSEEQIRDWDSYIDFLRKVYGVCMKYAPMNKLKGGLTKGLVKSQLQFAAKRRLIDEKLRRVVEEVNKDIAGGKRVVIFTSYINEGVEERGHLVGAVNTINDVSAQMVEGEAIIEDIPEALREKITLREEIKNYPLPLNIIQYIKDNVKGKAMAFVGDTPTKQRSKISKLFRENKIQCIIGSDAAKTGVSFHDLAGKQVVAYNIDPEFSVVTNAQMLGRVNRLGQKTKPIFKLVNSGAGGEQKFLITLAARMKNLGATSKGMAETASSKFLEDFALEGHLAHESAREAWGSLPIDEKEWFTNTMLWETIRATGQVIPRRSAPKDFMVDNYLYDLHLMPYRKANEMYLHLIDEYKKQLEVASDLVAIVGMKLSGKYLREIPLAEDVTLHEVQDKEGKKLGVLTGMLTDKMQVFGRYNISHYITFTAPDKVLSGLHVLPSKIPQVAKQFGKALAQTVTTDNAYDLVMAGDTIPLVKDLELYLRRNKDYIGIKNAKMKDEKALLAGGAKYSPVGNAWLLEVSNEAIQKFIKAFPIRQVEEMPTKAAEMAREPSMREENYAEMARKSADKFPTDYKPHFEMPELVMLATQILGRPPVIRKLHASWGKFYYAEGQEVAGIKITPEVFKDPRVAAMVMGHEIGHLFDWIPDSTLRRGNIIGRIQTLNSFLKHTFEDLKNPELRAELIALSEYWRPYDKSKTSPGYIRARQSSRELYADAVSVLLNNPDGVKKYAPTFYDAFFDALDKKPLVKQKLMELENFLNLGDEAKYKNRQDRIRNMYKKGEEEFAKVREENGKRRASIGLQAYYGLIDRAAGVLAKERELKKKGVALNPDDNPRYYLEEYNYLAGKIRNLLIDFDKKISLPMTEDGITRDDLDDYLFLNRIIHERKEIANPKGFTPETASWQMEHLLKSLGDERAKALKGYAEKFYTMNKELLTEAFEVGLYDREKYGDLLENPSYATFRVVDYIEEYVSAAIIHQMGTLSDIASPSTATVMKNVSILRAIERVKTADSIINMMQQHFSEDIEEASYSGYGKFKKIKEKHDRGVLKTIKNGQMKGYYVDPVIALSMDRNSTTTNNVIIRTIRACNSNYFRPIYVTINLGFQSYNLYRDFTRAWLLNPDRTLVGHIKSYFKALPHAKSRLAKIPTELIQEMQEEGMLSATYNDVLRGQTETESQIDALMKQYNYIRGEESRNFFKSILDGIADMGNLIETIPKVAGYMDKKGTLLHIKEKAHEVRVFSGSPDFLRKSGLYEYTNELFLFSNAMKEGMRGDFEGAFLNPRTRAGYWWKRAMITFLPKLIMFLATLGIFGRKRRELFDKISEYQKSHYTCIPIGETENGQVVYLRIPQDDQGRMLGALFWKALNWNKVGILETLRGLVGYTGGQLPSLSPIIQMVVVASQYIGGSNPRDMFRGQPILTYDEHKARGWYGAKKIGKWFMRQSGLLGFGYWWEEDDTTLVKFIKAAPILQRYMKITKYGETEMLRKKREKIEKERAVIRLKRKERQGR